MTVRGHQAEAQGFEQTADGTVYWTLSLYIEADKVASAVRSGDERLKSDVFRRAQRRHRPSLALSHAISPLLNDIADRETQGEVREFLLAATDANPTDPKEAAELVRQHEVLVFQMPKSVSWTTEGVRFEAHPPGLDDERIVRLRRFWMSHNNGALSYHLAFSHFYANYGDGQSGYDPSTYYFLALMQKLAAPKEYVLPPQLFQPTKTGDPDPYVDVFTNRRLDITPLDEIRIRSSNGAVEAFWPFVKTRFEQDAVALFPRLAEAMGRDCNLEPGFERDLLDLVPFIEVPGLKVPKSRFMFLLHDQRFFKKLMPVHPATGEPLPRKRMVQQGCYEPYQAKIRELTRPGDGPRPATVHLGPRPGGEKPRDEQDAVNYWTWVNDPADYRKGLAVGAFARRNPDLVSAEPEGAQNPPWRAIAAGDLDDLAAAMQTGECFQVGDLEGRPLPAPIRHDIPAFEAGRTDCLDYLFLAGFNQNIIDFMNQDTSEILDGIDPIYPDSSEQTDERFFVRYANHRAMISYVPSSRSLEIGNDYIGTCPYAFLIHALALHNEFLARGHEDRTMARVQAIETAIAGLDDHASPTEDPYDAVEMDINRAKLAQFGEYERYRHDNPFRYDTERDVFEKLERLRGISRKKEALSLAIASLEDHARDLRGRQQRRSEAKAARRGVWLSILLGMTGIFGAGQMFYWIGEKVVEGKRLLPSRYGEAVLSATEFLMTLVFLGFLATLVIVLWDPAGQWLQTRLRKGSVTLGTQVPPKRPSEEPAP